MTFDDGTPNACLMASDKSLKVTAYEIPCRVSNVAISNGKAVFNGAGVIACPFGLGRYVPGLAATSTYSTPFLLEASLSGLGASTSLTVGNPLLTHPSARYFTPRGATPYAAGYPAYFTTITSAAQQSTLMGALLPATKVTVRSVHQCAQQACALTHRTKLGANAALKTTFNTAGPVLFANAETTVYIGYSPADGTHLTGTVDVIHWDPQAGKGN